MTIQEKIQEMKNEVALFEKCANEANDKLNNDINKLIPILKKYGIGITNIGSNSNISRCALSKKINVRYWAEISQKSQKITDRRYDNLMKKVISTIAGNFSLTHNKISINYQFEN